jgi:rRNA maturation endonuclease Nob1
MKMFCKNCGKELAQDEKFCENCGKKTGFFENGAESEISKPHELEAAAAQEVNAPELPYTQQAPKTPEAETPIPQFTQAANKVQSTALPDVKEKPRKKKGCMITVIIFSAIVFCVIVFALAAIFWPSGSSSKNEDDDEYVSVQEADYEELMQPADLRGEGLAGYWVGKYYTDTDGNKIEAEEVTLLYFSDSGECTMRIIDNDMYEDAAGTYSEQSMSVYDDAYDQWIEFGLSYSGGDLTLELGEDYDNLCFVMEGPYDEETLVYQNLEYLKAASFMTSSVFEGGGDAEVSYEGWKHGVDTAQSHWDSLYKISQALEFAVYIDSLEEVSQGQANFTMPEINLEFGAVAYADSSYDVEEVKGVLDRAGSRNRIRMLARHLNVTAEEALVVFNEVQNEILKEAYGDDEFYGTCETYARRIKTGSKVALLVCGTVATGGTLSLGEGVVFFIQGADVAMEVTETEAIISYEIEGKRSSKKALEGLQNIRTWTAPASSIVGLKGLSGDGFDKFMVLQDMAFDAKDGKICAIKVIDSETGEMQVAHVSEEQFEAWKEDNRAKGYQLTDEDKAEIWKEILEKSEEEEDTQQMQVTIATNTPTEDPTEEPTQTATPEPTTEQTPETTKNTAANEFVGEWRVVAMGYPVTADSKDYENLTSRTELLGESEQYLHYEFKNNMTVDIYFIANGSRTDYYSGLSYNVSSGIATIKGVNNPTDTTVICLYPTRCEIIDGLLYLDFDCLNTIVYECEWVE